MFLFHLNYEFMHFICLYVVIWNQYQIYTFDS
jgi:hypothetical protein